MKDIMILDCTLRDGGYVNKNTFGYKNIGKIIDALNSSEVEIIECGWLKDREYEEGSTFYHVPSDLEPYILNRVSGLTYCAMKLYKI